MLHFSSAPKITVSPRGPRVLKGFLQVSLVLLAVVLASCERTGTVLAESQYRAALIGDWQGNVGEESESISFAADGSFSSQLRSNGFIGSTLGQGVTGAVQGAWVLQGAVITMTFDRAGGAQPLNATTHSTIVSFNQNQLLVKADNGETSTFIRAM